MEMVINFSGGKDSTAMLHYLAENYPRHKRHVIMADTGWEHEDAIEWSRSIVEDRFGLPLHVVRNPNKTFLTMVEKRGKFPSPKYRQCTSDLKRGPIQKWIRNNVDDRHIINCMGLRAAESPARAKLKTLKRDKMMTNGKRTVWTWLPIHGWSDKEVYQYLANHNLPLHPVYDYLNRFSCRLCIFNTPAQLKAIKKHDPKAFKTISALEEKIGFTMRHNESIATAVSFC